MSEGVTRLQWDSAFFGVRIGRVTDTSPEGIVASAETDIDCVYLLVESDDFEARDIALASGFEFVGHRVTYRSVTFEAAESTFEGQIRRIESPDLAALVPVAREAFRDSRFFWDRNFSEERAQMLYETWLRNSVEHGYHDESLCAVREGRPVGFVTLDVSNEGVGQIGLIGVAEDARGMGVGTALIAAAHEYYGANGASSAEVVTHGGNLGAQRLYARHGYLISRVESWFHRWSSE